MDKNTSDRLRKVQLEILDYFVDICNKNNLIYFLDGGTLLGAVRHKGFIPWDDDIDISMPRTDYEKFLDLADQINSNYYLLSERLPATNIFHNICYMKLCKKNTIFAEEGLEPENYYGIFIDIWPYDNAVLFLAPIHTFIIQTLCKLNRLKVRLDIPKQKYKLIFTGIICFFINKKLLDLTIKKLFIIFNKVNTKYLSIFCGTYGFKRETHKRANIFPLSSITFESKIYNAPHNYDNYLTRKYGDYMKLPPVEKQKGHDPKYIKFNDTV